MPRNLIFPVLYVLFIMWAAATVLEGFKNGPINERIQQRNLQLQKLQ